MTLEDITIKSLRMTRTEQLWRGAGIEDEIEVTVYVKGGFTFTGMPQRMRDDHIILFHTRPDGFHGLTTIPYENIVAWEKNDKEN